MAKDPKGSSNDRLTFPLLEKLSEISAAAEGSGSLRDPA